MMRTRENCYPTHFFTSHLFLLLIVLCLADRISCQASQWPYYLPRDTKYFPEHENLIRRDINAQARLQTQPIMGVKKMSNDPGQKFFLDYWVFEDEDDAVDSLVWTNQSTTTTFGCSFPVHQPQDKHYVISPRRFDLKLSHLFLKRAFQCPSGTTACTSINRPNSCCGSGSTCQIIQDTGLGDVGCCPTGQTCAGSLSTCPSGYSSCPNNPGGGCCLPGYACFDVGCALVATATQVVYPTPTTTSIPSTPLQPSTVTEILTVIVTPTLPSLQTLTTTVTTVRTTIANPSPIPSPTTTTVRTTQTYSPTIVPSPSTTTVTSTSITTSTRSSSPTCASGFRSCPASLGGGCCRTDRDCGSANCPATSATGSFVAPGRPTTEDTTTTTTRASTTGPVTGCPTGFYACSAYYQGGCCQIGRDCGMTSCPTSASTTLIDTNSLTVIAPTGSGITAPGSLLTGACATGWSTCPPAVGGGCCPSGYACGTSCTATASGGGGNQVGKDAPNAAFSTKELNFLFLLTVSVFSMVLAVGSGL